MAKKSKKRARQAARRVERREAKRATALPLDARSRLLKRIFTEARGRREEAVRVAQKLRDEAARREARARARGQSRGQK